MENKEVIEALKLINLSRVHPFYSWEEMKDVRDVAISALEKQIPKKPTCKFQIGVSSATGKIYKGKCCECGHEVIQKGWSAHSFCDNCGQALDWSDVE